MISDKQQVKCPNLELAGRLLGCCWDVAGRLHCVDTRYLTGKCPRSPVCRTGYKTVTISPSQFSPPPSTTMKITLALLCLTAAVTSNTLFSLEQPLYRAARQVPQYLTSGLRPVRSDYRHRQTPADIASYGGAPVSICCSMWLQRTTSLWCDGVSRP